MEHWKPIIGYEDSYLVSTEGRVFSLLRNKILKTPYDKVGYRKVSLCKNGTHKVLNVHRLVAEAFLENSL